jgi:uncharacterized protein (DUF3820 family)
MFIKNQGEFIMAESGEHGYEDIKIPFGKYKNELLADVPNSYLEWLLDQEFVETKYSKLYKLCKLEKHYRNEFDIYIDDED